MIRGVIVVLCLQLSIAISVPDQQFEIDLVVTTFTDATPKYIEQERLRIQEQLRYLTTDQIQPLSAGILPAERRYVIKHYFALCKNDRPELQAPDILHLDCTETYALLYEKTMAWWRAAMEIQPRSRFYVKRDMDTWPCWKLILNSLDAEYLRGNTDIYAGAFTSNSPVHHNPSDRWFDELFHNIAPKQASYWPYNQGAFYGLSAPLLTKVMMNKDHLQPVLMEDAMVGAWVLPLKKTYLSWGIDHSCACNRGVLLYHYCKTPEHIANCNLKEYSRCLVPGENYVLPATAPK